MKVDENRSSLKLFLQKTSLKENLKKPKLKIKIQQVERETLTPQVVLQKLDLKIIVEHIKEQIKMYKPNVKVEEASNIYIYIYHRLNLQLRT